MGMSPGQVASTWGTCLAGQPPACCPDVCALRATSRDGHLQSFGVLRLQSALLLCYPYSLSGLYMNTQPLHSPYVAQEL